MVLLWKKNPGPSGEESSFEYTDSDSSDDNRPLKAKRKLPPISPDMDNGHKSPLTSPEIYQRSQMDHSEAGKRLARYATDPIIVNWSELLQQRAANVFDPDFGRVEFQGFEGTSAMRKAQLHAFDHSTEPADGTKEDIQGDIDPVEAEARMVRQQELQRQNNELNRRRSLERHQERKAKKKNQSTSPEMEEALKEIRHAERRHRKLERRKKKEAARERQNQEQWYIEEQEFLKLEREKEAAREAAREESREEKRLRKEAKRAEKEKRRQEREREREEEREREREREKEREKKRREEEKARERRERQRQREEAERERVRQEEEAERERVRQEEEAERRRQEEEAERTRREERRERRRERRNRSRGRELDENSPEAQERNRRRREAREERARQREERATERAIRQVQAAERAAERRAERRRRRALDAQATAAMGPPPRDEYSTIDEDIPPYRERLHKYLDLVAYDERFAPILRVNRYLVCGDDELIAAINQFSSLNLLPKKTDLWNISHVDDTEYENMIPVLIPENSYYENEILGLVTPDTRSLVS